MGPKYHKDPEQADDDFASMVSNFKESEIRDVKKKVDKLINWDEGLAPQIMKLGKFYDPWIHIPVSSYNRTIYMFSSSKSGLGRLLELTSFVPWWTIPLVWFPVCFLHFQWAFSFQTELAAWQIVTWFLLGTFGLWSVFEYIVHRFVFHYHTESPILNVFHFMLHGVHHLAPSDAGRGVFPPVPATLFLYLPFFGLLKALGSLYQFVFPNTSEITIFQVRITVLCGFIIGYVMYDVLHWYYHNGGKDGILYSIPIIGPYLLHVRTCHMQHHYVRGAEKWNFALTPLVKLTFDHWFNTAIDPEEFIRRQQKSK